ncbi:MAG: SlyX family protein [Rhizobium sp.]|nr:SlyX family protein [Rhizobium sp.]
MNAAENNQAQRITRLEELVAHQSHTIDELSAELANQWTTVDQLQKTLERLLQRFSALEEASLEAPAITKPPHY